ncbi:hypothetical protein L1987_33987 [Smallanthus sonchifolius]|uniref:Uncharacterized protein n=1 Tax=Smallanthus sonchifolius TaxID=185202 RepID=A0ACB9HSL7_9ASTR|nr:hypothetical protein L1987_33987 [Smallanthus sonchifolius]
MVAHAYCHVTPKSTVPISRYGPPDGHDRLKFSLLSRILLIAIDTLISLHTSFSLIVSLSLSLLLSGRLRSGRVPGIKAPCVTFHLSFTFSIFY